MAERASTHWLDCARTSSRQIPSPDVCFCSAADVALRSASWSMTDRGSGWRRSACRRGDLCGGRAEKNRPGDWKRTRRSYCWRRATRRLKPHRYGEKRSEERRVGKEPARRLEAHQAQLLLAAGNPETEAAPVWRK